MMAALWWIVQNTCTIAVMIAVASVACRLFRNRPAVQHLLWVVVLLKFVTPSVVYWPWSVPFDWHALRSLVAAGDRWVLAPFGNLSRPVVTAVPYEHNE